MHYIYYQGQLLFGKETLEGARSYVLNSRVLPMEVRDEAGNVVFARSRKKQGRHPSATPVAIRTREIMAERGCSYGTAYQQARREEGAPKDEAGNPVLRTPGRPKRSNEPTVCINCDAIVEHVPNVEFRDAQPSPCAHCGYSLKRHVKTCLEGGCVITSWGDETRLMRTTNQWGQALRLPQPIEE